MRTARQGATKFPGRGVRNTHRSDNCPFVGLSGKHLSSSRRHVRIVDEQQACGGIAYPLMMQDSEERYEAISIIGLTLLLGCALLLSSGCRRAGPGEETPAAGPASSATDRQEATASQTKASAGGILFHDVTGSCGIDFVHTDGSSGRRYVIEPMSAGLLLFDYDNDGWIDIYFLNGAPLPGCETVQRPTNKLFRNLGGWKFQDVTAESGTGDPGYGLGVAAADFDNDGDEDFYINNFGPNVFFRNNGDGTFTDITEQTGTATGHKMGAGVCFLDVDHDGWVDLYVGNYIDFSFDQHRDVTINGVPSYPGPGDYVAIPDTLYHNRGDGTFEDISDQAGISRWAGTTMGMVAGDFDNDGDQDIFICNDVRENFLLINDGQGHFEEVAIPRGVAYDGSGAPQASMGVDCADLNLDGWFDLFMTSYQNELVTFYRNLGEGFFEDATPVTNAGAGSYPYVTWGVVLADFDNDGDRDVYIACGHVDDNVELRDRSTSYRARNIVLMNTGRGHFVNVTDTCGDGLQVVKASRGAAAGDLDNDGRIDLVVLNSRDHPTILRNKTANNNCWLQLVLEGRESNRSAIGARVKVVAGDLVQIDEVRSGRGYQSDWGRRLHFGLGPHQQVDMVEVTWPTGKVERWKKLPANQIVRLIEGQSAR